MRLAKLLSDRLERFYALCPEVDGKKLTPTGESTIATFNRKYATNKLSPASFTRASSFHAPTFASLADYDKGLASSEQSVRKALAQLDKTCDTLEAAEEQRKAQESRPDQNQNGNGRSGFGLE